MNTKQIFIIAGGSLAIVYITKKLMDKASKISKNFTWGEMVVTSTGLKNEPNKIERLKLIELAKNVLQPIRDLLGVPVRTTSVFRSELVNNAVGGVPNSQHRLAEAADIVPQMNISEAFNKIKSSTIPYDQLIIEKGKNKEMWIHVSYNPKKSRRQALVAEYNHDTGKMDFKLA